MYIGEVASKTSASTKAIRLYESMGLLVDIQRQGNYRIYTEAEVEFIRLIKQAQKIGITLSELKGLIVERNTLDWHAVMTLLEQKAKKIEVEITKLSGLKKEVYACREEIQECLEKA